MMPMRVIPCALLLAGASALVPVPRLHKVLNFPKTFNAGYDGTPIQILWNAPRAMAPMVLKAQTIESNIVAVGDEHVRDVCVAILLEKYEDPVKTLGNELDFNGFSSLVDKLPIDSTEQDKRTIFAMLDDDRSGSIDVSEIKNALRSTGILDSERIRTICIALLGQVGKIETRVEDGSLDSEIDFNKFSVLVEDLEIACSEEDKKTIFAMIDEDCGGTICSSEIKNAVRSSGAISKMYDDSLKTFGLLIAATLVFDGGIFLTRGATDAFDFFTAYAVEDSLSVDNLFVFLLLFRYFKVPPQLVDTCLNYGIGGSIILRGMFIYFGLAAANSFAPLNLVFSGFLLFSSYQLLADGEEDEEDEEPPAIILKLLDQLPITGTFEGEKFFSSGEDGSLMATQLTATLLTLALCDVLFAVDSIPAVLAINEDPFIVYTSNIAAVVGLRSLYQLLSVAVTDLVYLEKSVAIVLGFVGLKLGLEVAGVEVSSAISLGVILTSLTSGIVLSYAAGEEPGSNQPKPSSNLVQLAKILTGLNPLKQSYDSED